MPDDPSSLPYRRGVGVVLLNPDGLVWVGRRLDTQHAWQMPQGGIEDDPDPWTAALRELKEEVGTDNASRLAESRDWLTYDLPPEILARTWGGRFRGQAQKWFAARYLGRDADIDLAAHDHPEFDAWRWERPERLPDLIVPFKRPLYRAVLEEFRDLLG